MALQNALDVGIVERSNGALKLKNWALVATILEMVVVVLPVAATNDSSSSSIRLKPLNNKDRDVTNASEKSSDSLPFLYNSKKKQLLNAAYGISAIW